MALRQKFLMDKNWRFHFGDIQMHDCRHMFSKVLTGSRGPIRPDYDDTEWRQVDLPHDFVLEQSFSKTKRSVKVSFPLDMTDNPDNAIASHGYLPGGVGWYRKHFRIEKADKGKRITLVFDGLFRDARCWLNGLYLAHHHSGYNECRIDVTDLLRYGNEHKAGNVLAVKLDTRQSEGWFYEGGGIYRHAWLEVTPTIAVAPHGSFAWTRKVSRNGAAELEVRTALRNDTDEDAACRLKYLIVASDGKACARATTQAKVPAGDRQEEVTSITVLNARLWDLDDPHLYKLVTEVIHKGKTVDRTETTFGIRTIKFDANRGFFLNGKHVKIKGVCVHQNHAGVGTAMPDKLFEYRLRQLKKLGCNAYRCAHYPQANELLDACDRLGMLVMDETRSFSSAPEFMDQHETMILRDRNHPSIVIYSMANEEGIQNSPIGERMMQSIRRLARRLDPSRPLTTANNDQEFWGQFTSKHLDVQGCNYRLEKYDAFHGTYPHQPLIGTENSSRITTRGIYRHDPKRGYVDAYDRLDPRLWKNRICAEKMWQGIAARPFVAGCFVWTGIDYKGETMPYGWPTVSAHFGMLDSCCFPKDISHYFKTWWTETGDIHLFPHWNWPTNRKQPVEVWCYARHPKIELLLNGKSLGVKEMPVMGHLSWKVPYEPGVLEARGIKGNKVAAIKRIETTGAAYAVKAETDHLGIKADAEDIAVVNVSIVDKQGRVVPTADNPVEFDVTACGKILGVGNGDPSSHEPDKADKRRAFNGLCQVIIQSTGKAGTIRVRAKSKGLKPATLEIKAKSCRPRPSL